jgi:putative flippase GtrA
MDIIKIAQCIENNRNKLILGVRYFTGKVPFRSILGNKLTSRIFELINGEKISDTQTGLRGFSKGMIPWLSSIKGNGYEYEMNMLLESEKCGYDIKEVPIETVYIENNTSSHFNPLMDSLRIYLQILKYSMSSILCGILDFIFLLIIKSLTLNLLISVITARFFSSSINYVMNKNYVFSRNKGESNTTLSLPRYIFLVITVLIFNYIILDYLCSLGLNLIIAKLLTEGTLFIFSFVVQKRFVFK